MKLVHRTGLVAAAFHGGQPRGEGFTFVVKGAFACVEGAPARALPSSAQPSLDGERRFDDDRSASVRYPGDFAPWKPRADVTMVGTFQPGAQAVVAADVCLRVGALERTVRVVGARRWEKGLAGTLEATAPERLGAVPLRAELAFGGPGYAANPVGLGFAEVPSHGLALPQLEDPASLVGAPGDRPVPAGFAPVSRTSAPRTERLGRYDEAWLATRWPHLPLDADYRHFNAAPDGLQLEGYLRGDEPVTVEGLRLDEPALATRLPGLRPRVFALPKGCTPSDAVEVPIVLDTLWLDADTRTIVLVWRGVLATTARRGEDFERALLVVEPLAEAPCDAARYRDPARWELAVPSSEPAASSAGTATAVPPEGAAARATQEPTAATEGGEDLDEADGEAALDRDDPEAVADLRRFLPRGVDPEVLRTALEEARKAEAEARAAGSVDEAAAVPGDPSEAFEAPLREALAAAAAQGIDLSQYASEDAALEGDDEVEGEEEPPTRARWDRERVASAHARGERLDGADLRRLDLSRLELSGARLSGANLEGASLEGANLQGADLARAVLRFVRAAGANLDGVVAERGDLSGANLDGASLRVANLAGARLSGASLVGASLDGSDLHGAALANANLERASLVGVELSGASLDGARLVGTKAAGVRLRGASLREVDATGAELARADLGRATLERARFDRAVLVGGRLEGASGEGASFVGADVTNLRAGNGANLPRADFREAQGARGTFTGSAFPHATFAGATLTRASFRESNLAGADFHRARLEHADLTRAVLVGARLTKVNLFQARMPEVDLSAADCSRSNLFGAELFQAVVADARFDGTNLARTKLAGGPRG